MSRNRTKIRIAGAVSVAAMAVGTTALPASAQPSQKTGTTSVVSPCVGADPGSVAFLEAVTPDGLGILPMNLDFGWTVPAQLDQAQSGAVQIDGTVAITPELIATATSFGIVGASVENVVLTSDVTGPGSVSPSLDVNDPGPYYVDFLNPVAPVFAASSTVTASNQDGVIRYKYDGLDVTLGLDDGSGGDLLPVNLTCSGPSTITTSVVGTGVAGTQFDFNGNGSADRGVFRNGGWIIQGQPTTYFGLATDTPVPADYDGDTIADKAVYRNGAWLVNAQPTTYFGNATDKPVPADYDGDGTADKMVYRNGGWLSPSLPAVYFGSATDIPVPADYDGNGTADRTVYRPASGGWLAPSTAPVFFGNATDKPVPADYDGDGTADRMVFRPASGAWLSPSLSAVFFGNSSDRPVPADYDGNGTADRTVYRNGGWLSPSAAPVYLGLPTDRPLSTPIGQ
jgi:hypothetical protein